MLRESPMPKILRTLTLPSLTAAAAVAMLAGCASSPASETESPPADVSQETAATAAMDSAEESIIESIARSMRTFGYSVDWTLPPAVTAEDLELLQPAGDVLFLQSEDNIFTVRDADTGRFLWRQSLATPLVTFVGHARMDNARIGLGSTGVTADIVANVAAQEVFVRRLRTGALIDRQPLPFLVSTPPLKVGSSSIALAAINGRVIVHDLTTDVISAQFGIGAPIEQPLVSVNGDIAAAANNGAVAVIDPRTGSTGARRFRTFGEPGGPVATDGRLVFVASTDQSVYAFDTDRGEERWRYRTQRELVHPPAAIDGVVYVEVPDTGLVALDAANGSELWVGPRFGGSQVVATRDDELLVLAGDTIALVERNSGSLIDQVELPGIRRFAAVGQDDPVLYIAFDDGRIVRFRPE